MKVTEETKALAQGVVDYIMLNPDKHAQEVVWGVVKVEYADDGTPFVDSVEDGPGAVDYDKTVEENLCGTSMCIAGTAAFLHGGLNELHSISTMGDWEGHAAKLLGLNKHEANLLFYTMDNQVAVDATRAIAAGDVDKFSDIVGVYHNEDVDTSD